MVIFFPILQEQASVKSKAQILAAKPQFEYYGKAGKLSLAKATTTDLLNENGSEVPQGCTRKRKSSCDIY